MTEDLKTLFTSRSNEAWRDAHAPEGLLSKRTRGKCLFDSGYFALLANASAQARGRVTHHPDVEFIRGECAQASLTAEVGVLFAMNEHALFNGERPSREELAAWAAELRARLL
jgi:hypothetical protein